VGVKEKEMIFEKRKTAVTAIKNAFAKISLVA
jgi:hypothetical protein